MAEDEEGGGGAQELHVGAQPFDLAFHPSSNLVAVGLITGSLQLFKYEAGSEPQKLWTTNAHTESCRGVRFAEGGRFILSASADRSILATDPETGQVAAHLTNAHGAAINRIVNATETTVATGDDEGIIKIWDSRQNSCIGTFDTHEDFVADMEYVPASHQLLGASGDGTLSVCNLRRMKVDAQSQSAEDKLLSVVLVKGGRKVVCGSQEGILLIYSWGYFADCSDRFVGHPNAVNALLKLDEDTLVTGSSDGMIRVVSILPNKMTGLIGEHADLPIKRLAFSSDKAILGSAYHHNTVKLWDVKYLLEEDQAIREDKQETSADVPRLNADASASNDAPAQAPVASAWRTWHKANMPSAATTATTNSVAKAATAERTTQVVNSTVQLMTQIRASSHSNVVAQLPKELLGKVPNIKNTGKLLYQIPAVVLTLDSHMDNALNSASHLGKLRKLFETDDESKFQQRS